MSTPAGWYDDGSGRQRWWDGQQWTEQYAPQEHAPLTPPAAPAPVAEQPRRAPVLGFIGLGLAVVGTILACIPTVATIVTAFVVLFVSLVVSIVAVFRKATAKWPAIIGIVLSVVGGVIGVIVFTVSLLIGISEAVATSEPAPPAATAPETSEPATPPSDADGRPSPEEIQVGYVELAHEAGDDTFDDVPGFYECMAQALYDSEVSDEALQNIAAGVDVTGPQRELIMQVGLEAAPGCVPQ